MAGFIPALKIKDIVLGDGVVIKGEVIAGDARSLDRFSKALERFFSDWRELATKDQIDIDFSDGLTISGIKLRADQPKLKEKSYSVTIDMTNLSMVDRSKLFNFSQDDSKDLHFSITAKPKAKAGKTAKETAKTEHAEAGAEPSASPAAEASPEANGMREVVNHSGEGLDLPMFEANSVEERLQVALLIKDSGARERWAERVTSGFLNDNDLTKAIVSEWSGALYEAPDDGKHFIVQIGRGSMLKFHLACEVGVKVMINSKPTLQGTALLKKAREVLGLPQADKGKATSKGKSTGARQTS